MSPLLAFGLGPIEIGVLLLVILLLFGNRLPALARSAGKSIVEFKKGVSGADDESAKGEIPKS
jgi:sec-independent protein translocase protein TatA